MSRNEEEHQDREQIRLQQLLIDKLSEVSREMDRFNLAEYIKLLNSPRRFLFINFMAGIARGLGFAMGATILGALVLYFLQRIVVLNLPIIGDFVADLIKIVQQHL